MENIFKMLVGKKQPFLLDVTHRPGDTERLDTVEVPTIARRTLNTAGASLCSCSICERVVCLHQQQVQSAIVLPTWQRNPLLLALLAVS